MPCTTILVGKKASYDGSTMIARNDDSPSGQFTPKKFVVVHPEEQPKNTNPCFPMWEIDLPEDPRCVIPQFPMHWTERVSWAAHGINAAGVGMTATETITSNARVLGADPLVEYVPAKDGMEEIPAASARRTLCSGASLHSQCQRGCHTSGKPVEKYGTYEMNGIAFSG